MNSIDLNDSCFKIRDFWMQPQGERRSHRSRIDDNESNFQNSQFHHQVDKKVLKAIEVVTPLSIAYYLLLFSQVSAASSLCVVLLLALDRTVIGSNSEVAFWVLGVV